MIARFRELGVFAREFAGRFETTGSLVPSSRFLAREITGPLSARGDRPLRILECGPGTGAFTSEIVRHLRPGDRFDLVELNSGFARMLKGRFEADPHWQEVAGCSVVHQLPLQEFSTDEPYDYIISGLPHINFPVEVVAEVVACYEKLLAPCGTLSYFEYAYIRPIRKAATLGLDRRRINDLDAVMFSLISRHDSRRASVLRNFPPAWVRHLVATRAQSPNPSATNLNRNGKPLTRG